MNNPFDQFDEPGGNPFDQFDTPSRKPFVMKTALQTGQRFRDHMSREASRRVEFGTPGFHVPDNASDEDKHRAYVLNEWYDSAGMAGIGTQEAFDDPNRVRARKQWAIEQAEKHGGKPPEQAKTGAGEAFFKSAADSAVRFPVVGDIATTGIDLALGAPVGTTKDEFREMKAKVREDQPLASFGGDMAAYVAPGAQFYKGGTAIARGIGSKAIPPQLARVLTPTGTSTAAKMGRYVPQTVLPASAAAGADYALYEGSIGANNIEADSGEAMPFVERAGRTAEYLNPIEHPEGYAFGAGASPVYRLIRGGVTTAKNSTQASWKAQRPQLEAGTLTPKPRREEVSRALAELNDVNASVDPTSRAYRIVAKALDKDEISQDMLIDALSAFRYNGYSSVDEMLFELASAATNDKGAGKINELVRALATVGGDAQSFGRQQGAERAAGISTRIRDDIRKAAGLSGADFDSYGVQLADAAETLPRPLYDEAYSRTISNGAFRDGVLPIFQSSPQARDAIFEAADYAIGVARSKRELAVAQQTADELTRFGRDIDQLRAGQITPDQVGPLSTRSYDYIIRMLGDAGHATRHGSKRTELARGFEGPAYRLRRIVDEPTGLGEARATAAELKAASKALDFGVKAARNGTALRDIQKEFAKDLQKHADSSMDVFEGSTINSSLLMGWTRGAEDVIEKATNSTTAIRQLYGSERQRAKMKEMLLGLDQTAIARAGVLKAKNPNLGDDEIAKMVQQERAGTSTGNSDSTKRLRQVVGDKYRGNSQRGYETGDVRTQGRFDRELRMAEANRDLFHKSPTGRNNAAVAEQGGNQRMAETFVDKAFRYGKVPINLAHDVTKYAVRRATQPAIYDEAINRELGKIVFASGDDNLKSIVETLSQYRKPPRHSAPQGDAGSGTAAVVDALSRDPRKAAQAGFVDTRALVSPAGRTALGAGGGAYAPIDHDGDGEISAKERVINALVGAGAARYGGKAMGRTNERLRGSRNLPPKTKRFTDKGNKVYETPTRDGGTIRTEFNVGNDGLVRVEMDVLNMPKNGKTGSVSQAKEVFDGTFRAVQDHAVRHKPKGYVFAGTTASRNKMYANQVRRNGAPDGYVGIIQPGAYGGRTSIVRTGSEQHKYAQKYHADDWEIITKTAGAREGIVLQSHAAPAEEPIMANGLTVDALKAPGRSVSKMMRTVQRGLADPTDPRHMLPHLEAAGSNPIPGQSIYDAATNPRPLAKAIAEGTGEHAPGAVHLLDGPMPKRAGRTGRGAQAATQAEQRVQRYLNQSVLDDTAEGAARMRIEAAEAARQNIMASYRAKLRQLVERYRGANNKLEIEAELRHLIKSMPGMSRKANTQRMNEMVRTHIAQIERGSVRAYPEKAFQWKSAPEIPARQTNHGNAEVLRQEQSRIENMGAPGGQMDPRTARELADLSLNPARADEALEHIARGRHFDSFDKTGQTAALLAGASGTALTTHMASQGRSQVDPAAIARAENQRLLDSYTPSDKQEIIRIQSALVAHGMVRTPKSVRERGPAAEAQYLRDWIDGGWGPQTKDALRAFQGRKGLPATGKMTSATAQLLYADLAEAD